VAGGFLRLIAKQRLWRQRAAGFGAPSTRSIPRHCCPRQRPDHRPDARDLHAVPQSEVGLSLASSFTLDGDPASSPATTARSSRTARWCSDDGAWCDLGLGGGIVAIPWEGAVLSALALDPSGTPTNSDVTEALSRRRHGAAGAQVLHQPFDRWAPGVQVMWSNKERFSLTQDHPTFAKIALFNRFRDLRSRPILERISSGSSPSSRPFNLQPQERHLGRLLQLRPVSLAAAGDPARIGVFFTFGATDGNPNPIKYSYNMGNRRQRSGAGRPNDNFGIAGRAPNSAATSFRSCASGSTSVSHEDAVEITTAPRSRPAQRDVDLQVVNRASRKHSTRQPAHGCEHRGLHGSTPLRPILEQHLISRVTTFRTA